MSVVSIVIGSLAGSVTGYVVCRIFLYRNKNLVLYDYTGIGTHQVGLICDQCGSNLVVRYKNPPYQFYDIINLYETPVNMPLDYCKFLVCSKVFNINFDGEK